ncbi:hypothetical protein M670_02187 [Schinkia azotoformans MEV2011]|uniref:Uncharacterized protein n=2 Tax=Schinkia azotoformans TaxID=1454 RepID=K6E203_SCHAZ|nr:hypothetical protein [Schinkia azotoformans]EKN67211.1 hypothetical protein BAZO_09806 [Schinkia azotoformans LMG 9581]KEF38561.1 hypothetical protein M670_02187 [Schinkia azotoformans MEV2011]MEC1639952.1 hypothetical protein [Schinkia azotoformans]MEC1695169.1 hypothetical protein [Schinkia azotoformans]MEC1717586.1 hypothetical protein [Schinkia azotoformans]
MFEKLYLIYNPLTGTKDWVSEREFKIGSLRLKKVFGVLYLYDLKFMLQFNPQFKNSIVKENSLLNEEQICLKHVCRLITKDELAELLNNEATDSIQSEQSYYETHPSRIEIKDGFFMWNEEKGCYEEAVVNA